MSMSRVQRWRQWREDRERRLAAPDSWLGLIGLVWLQEGANAVGADAAATVVLPAGPAHLGQLVCAGTQVAWQPAAGDAIALRTDAGGEPSVVDVDGLAFFVIERDGRLAVRVRDLEWAKKRPFSGLETFAYDPAWRVVAEWRPLDPPQTLMVPDASGELKSVTVAWQAAFRIGDASVALLPTRVSDAGALFVFRDATSGRQTYGAGRFLDAPSPVDGRIVLDFNRAYSPPCAFTAFATCPLPPPENRLPFAIVAGERFDPAAG